MHEWWKSIDDRWIPSQRASNAGNVFIWIRHDGTCVMLWNPPGVHTMHLKQTELTWLHYAENGNLSKVSNMYATESRIHSHEEFHVIYQMIVNITRLQNPEVSPTGIGLNASKRMYIYLNHVMYLLIHALISTDELHNYKESDKDKFYCIYISTVGISWTMKHVFRFLLVYNLLK